MLTYEESVQWMRRQPQYTDLVKLCYLDADNFEAARRFHSSEEFQEISRLLDLNTISKPATVLDLSCGNGIASFAFASLGLNVVAVDPDVSDDVGLRAVQRLKKLSPIASSIKTVQAFAEDLPFPDKYFERVYIRQGAHHFSDLEKGFSECFRVLKPLGHLLASREHVVSNEKQLQIFLKGHVLHRLHGGENAHTVQRYKSAIRMAGFKKVKVLAPYDNVINYFPKSNTAIKRDMYNLLKIRFGKHLGNTIAQIYFSEKAYKKYLSLMDNSPGRLYSFLCMKL